MDLRDVGHPDMPVLVDMSAPIPGTVTDGNMKGLDIDYQNSTSIYCGSWDGFVDGESGIGQWKKIIQNLIYCNSKQFIY